ncbi:MAG: hypothetical protein ACLGI7_12165 [Gammaproteobacteria bacterium]
MTATRLHTGFTGLAGAVLALGAVVQLHAQGEDEPTELPPVVVEGERSELDSIGGIYRRRLPCVGTCEESARVNPVERVLEGIQTLFIASSLPEQPQPRDSLGITQPTKARLEDKMP